MGKNIKKIIIISLVCGLVGCGFKLRSSYAMPEYLQQVNIITEHAKSSFIVQFIDGLRNNGVSVSINTSIDNKANNTVDKKYRIEIHEPSIAEQVNGYNSKGQISQYRLAINCGYKLFSNQGKLVRENNISRFRNYNVNPNQLLSNANEKQVIIEELQIDIIDEILRQLSHSNIASNDYNSTR
jgi:outer membrane lipopolysaccharide assembly protein LptE/RlpB